MKNDFRIVFVIPLILGLEIGSCLQNQQTRVQLKAIAKDVHWIAHEALKEKTALLNKTEAQP